MTRGAFKIDDLIALVKEHQDMVEMIAQDHRVDPLTLRTRLLLQLPFSASPHYLPDSATLQREARHLALRLVDTQHQYLSWLKTPERIPTLSELTFVELDDERARVFHERFHYVCSYRPGRHFALTCPETGQIACMGSIADFDLAHAAAVIKPTLDLSSVDFASRFFAFRWTPKNAFTLFFGKVSRLLKADGKELLLSFINPNVGFSGSSHKAAQFSAFAMEDGARYTYVDGEYQTMRKLIVRFGTFEVDKLRGKLGGRLAVNTLAMKPLILLAKPLSRRAQKTLPPQPWQFHRPSSNAELHLSR
jgi:hypothetical protein